MAAYKSDPEVVKKWDAARGEYAKYSAKITSAKTVADRNKYQKLAAEALKECNKWYGRL